MNGRTQVFLELAEVYIVSRKAYERSQWDEPSAACVGALMKMDDAESYDSLQSVGLGWAGLPGGQFYSLLTCLTSVCSASFPTNIPTNIQTNHIVISLLFLEYFK